MNTWQPKITATEAGLIYCVEPIFGSGMALFLPALFSAWAAIDYPNETDRRVYESESAAGRIPLFARQLPGIGGRVGIHGNDRPRDQASGRDWTRGCIAMRNEDVAVLYDLVDVGTPVLVLP